jgi:hypothetical protein
MGKLKGNIRDKTNKCPGRICLHSFQTHSSPYRNVPGSAAEKARKTYCSGHLSLKIISNYLVTKLLSMYYLSHNYNSFLNYKFFCFLKDEFMSL